MEREELIRVIVNKLENSDGQQDNNPKNQRWPIITLNDEVARGKKLRDVKLRSYGCQKPLDMFQTRKLLNRSSQVGQGNVRTKSCRPVSAIPIMRSSSPITSVTKKHALPFTRISPDNVTCITKYLSRPTTPNAIERATKAKRCPLRIAELAEPSKRHCLETWKAKGASLPPLMLDRLKKQVHGQKVLATIPDAINCFNQKRKSKKGQDKQNAYGRITKKRQTEEMAQMRNLCAVFAHSVAKKLIQPVHICLSEDLAKLSQTIMEEIIQILGNKTNRLYPDYLFNPEILAEMSGKITYWISSILDDAYYKLLEDEYRAKRVQENRQGKEGHLVTLIEKYILMHFEERGDLEEEEGPALDVLDTLIDNVVKLCIPKSDSENDSPDSNHTVFETEGGEIMNEFCERNDIQDEHNIQDLNENLNETENKDDMSPKAAVYQIPTLLDDANYDVNLDYNTDEFEGTEAQIRDILNAIVTEANLNVSEVFVVVAEEQDDDKKNVTFNEVDTDIGGFRQELKTVTGSSRADTRTSSDISLSRLHNQYAPPNENLLSFADESWPSEIKLSTLKPSLSVSKSVASMGNIQEERVVPLNDSEFITSNDEILEKHNRPFQYNSERTYAKAKNYREGFESNRERSYDKAKYDSKNYREGLEYNSKGTYDKAKNDSKNYREGFQYNRDGTYDQAKNDFKNYREGFEYDREGTYDKVKNDSKNDRERIEYKREETYEKAKNGEGLRKDAMNGKDLLKKRSDHSSGFSGTTHIFVDRNNKSDESINSEDDKKITGKHVFSRGNKQYEEYISSKNDKENSEKDKERKIDSTNSENDKKYAGKGDHQEKNPIKEAITKKLSLPTKQKFDYKVHPQTAPSWAVQYSSEESLLAMSHSKKEINQCVLRKWCTDLDYTLDNLDKWNKWIDNTCRKILTLKLQTEAYNNSDLNNDIKVWTRLKKSIDRDAVLWRTLNQRTLRALSRYDAHKIPVEPKTEMPKLQDQNGVFTKQSVCEVIDMIDGVSSFLHRSIVSAQYCVKKCHCKYLPRSPPCSKIPVSKLTKR